MTTREVAQLLGVSSETVLRWHRRRVLAGYRLPSGALRFRACEVDEWLEERAERAEETS